MSETLTMRVQSQTDPRLTYTIHARGGEVTCSCRGYVTWRRCLHAEGIKQIMAEDNDTETAVAVRDNAPPAALVVGTPGTALLPSRDDMRLMTDIAKTVFAAGGGMLPKHIQTPHQALAIMIAGHELGLRPMTSLRHVFIVNGKTEIETRAMVGIIKARDERIQFEWPEYTADAVTCIVKRPGQTAVTVRYTREDAKASGQMKPGPWTQYTRDMLYAAATKRACRLAAPDIINAIDSGMQHTVIEAEAVAADLPANEPPPLGEPMSEIPAEAYNEGDTDPEPAPELPEQPAKVRLGLWLVEQRRELGIAQFKNIVDGINRAYPGALTASGDPVISGQGALDDAGAQRILDGLAPADAPEGQATFDA